MKYNFIDSARGIAILMVILVHTSQSLVLPEGWIKIFSKYGQMGVQLFFLVSAYTLCLSYHARKNENRAVRNFYIRRFFRIAPVYYLAIFGYMIFRGVLNYLKHGEFLILEQYSLINIFANVFFVHGLYAPANENIVPGGWSIGTEMLFYLVFPLVIFCLSKSLLNKIVAFTFPLIMVILSSGLLIALEAETYNNGFAYFSILNQSSVFALGISFYFIHAHHEDVMAGLSIFMLFVLGTIFLVLSIYLGWLERIDHIFTIIPFISAISFLFYVEILKRGVSDNWTLLQSIGQRSYSMYIIHFVFAHQLSTVLNKHILIGLIGSHGALFFSYLLTVALTYYFAGISAHYFEKYFIGLGKKVIRNGDQARVV